ncbi:MAG: hypothetical protein JWN76_1901 [Chitinophagaceae bacterium]|nr:hypothetical protein [Chitinophagaceae bacterium]
MKKILFVALLVTGFAFTSSAQTTTTTTTTTHRYYYYPDANVYYEPSSSNYWYYDEPSTKWVTVRTLPSGINVAKRKYKTFNYIGTDPWKDEAFAKKYKVKKNGKVKTKD